MFNSAKIAELMERITSLECELENAKGQTGAITAERNSLSSQLTQAKADLQAALERITTLETDHAAALERIEGEIETRVQLEVTNRCAAAGVAPIARDPQAAEGPKTMNRAEFGKLTPAEQSAHCLNGGTVTD